MNPKAPVPEKIAKAEQSWLRAHRQWIYAHYALLLVGNACAISATFARHDFARYLSLAAALCFGVVSVFNPFKISQSNARAHDRLRHAVMQYENLPDYPIENLLKEFDAAQQLINKGRE